jgi:hypothetical protein
MAAVASAGLRLPSPNANEESSEMQTMEAQPTARPKRRQAGAAGGRDVATTSGPPSADRQTSAPPQSSGPGLSSKGLDDEELGVDAHLRAQERELHRQRKSGAADVDAAPVSPAPRDDCPRTATQPASAPAFSLLKPQSWLAGQGWLLSGCPRCAGGRAVAIASRGCRAALVLDL